MRLIKEFLTDNSRAALFQLDNGKYQAFFDDNGQVRKYDFEMYLQGLAKYGFFEKTLKERTK